MSGFDGRFIKDKIENESLCCMPGFNSDGIVDGRNFIFSFTNGKKLQIKSGSPLKKKESTSSP